MLTGQLNMYPVYDIPRPVQRYLHRIGDNVRLRRAMGKLNNVVMESIVQRLGRENLTVLDLGSYDQVKIRNDNGDEDGVPGVFLTPSSVTNEEDYPPQVRPSCD